MDCRQAKHLSADAKREMEVHIPLWQLGIENISLRRGRSMHVFVGFNPAGPPCPICRSRANLPTVLAPIPDTFRPDKPGSKIGICQGEQIHKACYDLWMKMTFYEEADNEPRTRTNG